jgi:hypothetical protein
MNSEGKAIIDDIVGSFESERSANAARVKRELAAARLEIFDLEQKYFGFGKYLEAGPGDTMAATGVDHYFESATEGPHCLWHWQGPINGPKAATK